MPFCTSCGFQEADDSRYCSACGTPIAKALAQGNSQRLTSPAPTMAAVEPHGTKSEPRLAQVHEVASSKAYALGVKFGKATVLTKLGIIGGALGGGLMLFALWLNGSTSFAGEFLCGSNLWTFSKDGTVRSSQGIRVMSYKIDKGYIFILTPANQWVPLLKKKGRSVFRNMEGTGYEDVECHSNN
jgi:hypothetical protein